MISRRGLHECTKVCLSGTVAPESVNTPPKTNKFKTKQLVAHLEVKVGENHKLEASLGYTVRPGLSEQTTYIALLDV